jgi:hypothetical protein
MGSINWIAVVIAAALAALVLRLFWGGSAQLRGSWFYLLQIVPAAMLGHALARIGPEKLAAKPHLFWMQSGGLALAIAIPALWMTGKRDGAANLQLGRDSLAFLLAYLAMGLVFFAMR